MAAQESEGSRIQLSWEQNAAPAQQTPPPKAATHAPKPEPEAPPPPRSELLWLPEEPAPAPDVLREIPPDPDPERENLRLAQVFDEGPLGSEPREWGGRRPARGYEPLSGRRSSRGDGDEPSPRRSTRRDEIASAFDRAMTEGEEEAPRGRRPLARITPVLALVAGGGIFLLWAAVQGLRELSVPASLSYLIVGAVAVAGGVLLAKRFPRKAASPEE